MDTPGIIDQAIREIERLTKTINANRSIQVRTHDERELIKANAFSWFKGHRTHIQLLTGNEILNLVDENFHQLLEFSDKHTSRSRYKVVLKSTKGSLIKLRSEAIKFNATDSIPIDLIDKSKNSIPDFSPLVRDQKMQKILVNRWNEIIKCLECDAPLAATIMMGGLLEALFLARANKLSDKSPLYIAKAAPIDSTTKKVVPLDKWMLNSFIEVAAELGWIRKPAKEIGIVLRDYRNFIHPERELRTGFTLEKDDATMFWQIFSQVAQQILNNANK